MRVLQLLAGIEIVGEDSGTCRDASASHAAPDPRSRGTAGEPDFNIRPKPSAARMLAWEEASTTPSIERGPVDSDNPQYLRGAHAQIEFEPV